MKLWLILFLCGPLFFQKALASQGSICAVEPATSLRPEQTICPHQKTWVDFGSSYKKREVLFALPQTPKPVRGYPVAFVFQGSFFQVEFSRTDQLPFGGYNEIKLIERLLNSGFAVIAPRPYLEIFWSTNTPILSQIYDELADYLLMKNLLRKVSLGAFGALDSKNIFATGISSGGYQTSRVGITFEGSFRALAIQSASYATCLGPLCNVPEVLPRTHPPTLLLHGERDKTVPAWTARDYFSTLRKNNVPAQIHINPSAGHEWLKESPQLIVEFFQRHRQP